MAWVPNLFALRAAVPPRPAAKRPQGPLVELTFIYWQYPGLKKNYCIIMHQSLVVFSIRVDRGTIKPPRLLRNRIAKHHTRRSAKTAHDLFLGHAPRELLLERRIRGRRMRSGPMDRYCRGG
jgi:hypothetical protein